MKSAQILCIETSGEICSVALHSADECLAARSFPGPFNHASHLHVGIEEILEQTKRIPDAIAVSSGPGSYTGLRIGVSAAKGLAFGYDVPLISVPTLGLMVSEFLARYEISKNERVMPMIDARRLEVYTGIFNSDGISVREEKPLILDSPDIDLDDLSSELIHIIGDGALKASSILDAESFRFYPDEFLPKALWMGIIAHKRFNNKQFEDVAYFEPNYIKEFFFAQKAKK